MISYRKGYKYQLAESYVIIVPVKPISEFKHDHLHLTSNGMLTIAKGYAWDGPSGPTIDTKTFMRASLVHDALYQLMRMGMITTSHRKIIDRVLRQICIEDGMNIIRAWYVYNGVRFGAASAASIRNIKKIFTAP